MLWHALLDIAKLGFISHLMKFMKICVHIVSFVVFACRKDANGFFAFPVTENIAPGYYSIITRPMDFSTMKAKIHNGDYHNVAEYKVQCA